MKKSNSATSAKSTQTFLRQRTLLERYVPFSAATLWRKVKSGRFPRPIKVTDQITAWRTSDIEDWANDPTGYTQGTREVSS